MKARTLPVLVMLFPLFLFSGNRLCAQSVMGGGETMLVGGDGGMMQKDPTLPTPVITLLSFHATTNDQGTAGQFECLALGPAALKSFEPGSGNFTNNIMYVTGTVTGLTLGDESGTLTGTCLITGVGAGVDLDFTFEFHGLGEGAYMVLTTENPEAGKDPLVFREQMIDGDIRITD